MFVTDVNDVKIYNLSAGKSLPDWLTDRKRRQALRKDVDLRRRIELIQDFDMPAVSTNIKITKDGQYIMATGTYKPRIKCYDVNNLSLKFERCFDAECVAFEILSDDYGKLAFLQSDRYLEFHAAPGRHYRLRVPRFGRDLTYHTSTCDLLIVGSSSEIYRLNLERGQFLQPYQTAASSINVCDVNPEHQLIMVGTHEGTVEAWDPRDRKKSGSLDIAVKIQNNKNFPSVTSLKFKNGLQMAVGTASGHVLLYDIRSKDPILIKDHMNQAPIKKLGFNRPQNLVYSMDEAMLKIWDENTGKQTAYIESGKSFNDFATYENTGMFFFAQEDVKMLSYYIPSLGPAPRWCSFLDNLTEEIESETVQNIYDDYKFVTKQELGALGLDHLEGTEMLRAYMHGFFIDVRLYHKAKEIAQPFAYQEYKKEKIQKQIEADRPKRLQIKTNLPKVNKELALKLMEESQSKGKNAGTLLKDDRFKAMFEDPDFQVDKTTNEYRLLTPVLTRLDKTKVRKLEKAEKLEQFDKDVATEDKEEQSTDDDLFSEKDESSDDDNAWTKDVKKEFKKIKKEQRAKDRVEEDEIGNEPKMYEVLSGEDFKVRGQGRKISKASLGSRIAAHREPNVKMIGGLGNREITFSTEKPEKMDKRRMAEMRRHRDERKKVIRPVTSLGLKKAAFQMKINKRK